MRYQTIVAAALSAATVSATDYVTGKLGDAPEINDNPVGVTYIARLPKKAFTPIDVGGNVEGYVTASSRPDGKGVEFRVSFSNLPKEGGPFGFHIHDSPVPEDGNCTLAKAHLDPYQRGADPPCNRDQPKSCEVGDLSGKHGKIPDDTDAMEKTFTDYYASTKEGIGAFLGNRSVVLHYGNSSRITCANFALLEEEDDGDKPGHGDDDHDEDCEDEGGHGGDEDEEEEDDTTPPPADGGAATPTNGTRPPPPQDTADPDAPVEVPGTAAATAVSLFAAFAAAMFAL